MPYGGGTNVTQALMLSTTEVQLAKHVIGNNPVSLVMQDGSSWPMDGQFGRSLSKDGKVEVYFPMALASQVAAVMTSKGWA